MTTKIKVHYSNQEFEVETESESDARKLIDDLTAKFHSGDTKLSKMLSE